MINKEEQQQKRIVTAEEFSEKMDTFKSELLRKIKEGTVTEINALYIAANVQKATRPDAICVLSSMQGYGREFRPIMKTLEDQINPRVTLEDMLKSLDDSFGRLQ